MLIGSLNPAAYGRAPKSFHRYSDVGQPGRLILQRFPTVGHNVRIDVVIDGQFAGLLSRGRIFDGYIAPGRHWLLLEPNGLDSEWLGVIDVRPGETHAYKVTYNVNRLGLNPLIPGW